MLENFWNSKSKIYFLVDKGVFLLKSWTGGSSDCKLGQITNNHNYVLKSLSGAGILYAFDI